VTVISRLALRGLRRGLVDGSRPWLYVGVAAVAMRVLRWVLVQPEETVYEGEVKPGEAIEIRTARREPEGNKRRRR
jgi:hypothetical protein